MKIAWMSNAPWAPTGYGQQTAQVLPRLVADGHDVAVIANYGLQGGVRDWEGIRVYPSGSNWSNDVIAAHATHWFDGEPGLLVTLYDVWTLEHPAYREMTMAGWVPIDHAPAPRLVARHFAETGSVPIAMSDFGRRQLAADGLDPLYVPHGIDTQVFAPVPDAKAMFGIPEDVFLVGMVSTNNSLEPCRKAYPEALMAFRRLLHSHPDALLYIHAENRGALGGLDLVALATGVGIPTENLLFVDGYRYRNGLIGQAELANLYSAFDVLLFPSMGEGFGIPTVEAQACGTPVIVTNFSAQAELVGPGYATAWQPRWDPAQLAYWATPLIDDIAEALVHAAEHRDHLVEIGPACREFALGYDADHVYTTYWQPALETLEGLLPSTAPIRL
jgi:glycosyltransferase involved in cell wall biosynthesis